MRATVRGRRDKTGLIEKGAWGGGDCMFFRQVSLLITTTVTATC